MTALKLDDRLPEAHAVLAVIKLGYDWDWSGAEREFKGALAFNPTNSDLHQQYSFYLTCMGRFDEALAEAKRAEELDPVSLVKMAATGQALIIERRNDDAIAQIRSALEMDPNLAMLTGCLVSLICTRARMTARSRRFKSRFLCLEIVRTNRPHWRLLTRGPASLPRPEKF